MDTSSKAILKIILTVLVFGNVFLISSQNVSARSGCCSHHDGVCGCGCCDGTPLSTTCAPYYPECSGGGEPAKIYNPPLAAPVSTPRPVVSTPKPTVRPAVRPTIKPTPKPTATPIKCSDVSDSVCSKSCTAGNDIDCCGKKSGYSWYENYGCYPSTSTRCSATQDNSCSSMCSAGNDYDCCLKLDGYTWYDNWGCYPKNL